MAKGTANTMNNTELKQLIKFERILCRLYIKAWKLFENKKITANTLNAIAKGYNAIMTNRLNMQGLK